MEEEQNYSAHSRGSVISFALSRSSERQRVQPIYNKRTSLAPHAGRGTHFTGVAARLLHCPECRRPQFPSARRCNFGRPEECAGATLRAVKAFPAPLSPNSVEKSAPHIFVLHDGEQARHKGSRVREHISAALSRQRKRPQNEVLVFRVRKTTSS